MSAVMYSPTWRGEIQVIFIGIPGPAGTGFTAAEAAQARTDLNTLLARPNISTLQSLTNVPTTGMTSGQTIVWNGSTWVYGNPNSSLTSVTDGTTSVANVTTITTAPGIAVTQQATGNARLAVQFPTSGGANGTATTAARSDHSHAGVIQQMQILPYQGVLSTGFRTLSSAGITGLTASETYDITLIVTFDVVAAGVNSVITPRASLGTGALDGYDVQFSGHGKGVTIYQTAVATGVTSFPMLVRVFYTSGPQVEIGAGEILAIARPRR